MVAPKISRRRADAVVRGGRGRGASRTPAVKRVLVFGCLSAYMGSMSDSTRWNLIVSRSTDDALRQFLAGQGRGRKGELSRFVEEAVQARILELAAADAKRQNAHLSLSEIAEVVDEALEWARRA
jgi:hypothetical protein